MEDEANSEVEVYISKDQQRVLALDDNITVSDETRLTKGDASPPAATSVEVSEINGSTR